MRINNHRLCASILIGWAATCLMPLISMDQAEAQQDAAPDQQIRQEIERLLGDEDGYFLFVFNKQIATEVPATVRPPMQARRLSGNRWLEELYQVELAENRDEASEMLLKYFQHAEQNTRPGITVFDWQMVDSYDDESAALDARDQALQTASQRNATLRQHGADGVKFFNFGEPEFFQR